MQKTIDELGRVVVPANMRKTVGLSSGSKVEIALDGDRIIIKPIEIRCKICDSVLTYNRDICVCDTCIARIKNL